MINSQEIKKGTCIRMDGGIWKCIWFEHRKPGKGNTVMNTKLKNVADMRGSLTVMEMEDGIPFTARRSFLVHSGCGDGVKPDHPFVIGGIIRGFF